MAFQGSLRELPLPDIIQLVAVSGKTGVFVLRNGAQSGKIFLEKGQIVHAEVAGLSGEQAVYELARWLQGDFVFTPGAEAEARTVDKSNTNLLMEAARQIDEWKILSKKIESTSLVPVFAAHAGGTSVSFSPGEWAVITRVDERRSIEDIAAALGQGAFEICKVVYGLLTSGVLSLREDLRNLQFDRVQRLGAEDQTRVAEQVHRAAQQLLAGVERADALDSALRLSHAEIGSGRGADALQSLVRSEEKLISATLGPNQAKAFLERVAQILQAS
ncbi:MAG: DUF4388 domain-containing protein [Acidobacteria bacterium]|nr:DUF4388 domain-containing protein [Acidobacteriota bacterium]MCB9377918.1 DUF4388 domain-containing protein [Holophagales bacterium]